MKRAKMAAFALLGAGFLIAGTWEFSLHGRRATPGRHFVAWPATAGRAQVPALARALRPVYPFSVVPGGVYTPEELRTAMNADPIVHEHYQGLNLNRLHLIQLAAARRAFVSYRKGDNIFWTQRALLVSRGEPLLTDDRNYVKTRCGNRLSLVPLTPARSDIALERALMPKELTLSNLPAFFFANRPIAVRSLGFLSASVPVPETSVESTSLETGGTPIVEPIGKNLPSVENLAISGMPGSGVSGAGIGGGEGFPSSGYGLGNSTIPGRGIGSSGLLPTGKQTGTGGTESGGGPPGTPPPGLITAVPEPGGLALGILCAAAVCWLFLKSIKRG